MINRAIQHSRALPLQFWNGLAGKGTAPKAVAAKPIPASGVPTKTPGVSINLTPATGKPVRDVGRLGSENTFEALKKAYGSVAGEDGYRKDLDFDQDGEIGIGDYAIFSANYKGPDKAPEKAPDELDLLRAAYNTSTGDKGYDKRVDFNQDGSVDIADYAILSDRRGREAAKAREFEAFKAAYGSTDGDKNFDKKWDLDGDGEVGIGDYAIYSAKYA
ncbi:MAG: hypothetical protein K1X67_11900 [Fimbriimonadaceae bacterium]|nr:hypothetical protein [Fimbriimonadaceae bacterium]